MSAKPLSLIFYLLKLKANFCGANSQNTADEIQIFPRKKKLVFRTTEKCCRENSKQLSGLFQKFPPEIFKFYQGKLQEINFNNLTLSPERKIEKTYPIHNKVEK